MVKKSVYLTFLGVEILLIFFLLKLLIIFDYIKNTELILWVDVTLIGGFVPIFISFINIILNKQKKVFGYSEHVKKLNETIVSQSHNPLFYQGNIDDGAKTLTKEVSRALDINRCSIWLYNKKKTAIICEQLYINSEDKWYKGQVINKVDFEPYFNSLLINPIIIANDSESNPATSCLKDTYLKPLGIKSMMNIPIRYKGDVIGIMCMESCASREWDSTEINFGQIISALYTFAYSTKEINKVTQDFLNLERFISSSVLVSKTDSKGRITYVNKKFEDVSGWLLNESMGKDHKIVNSGEHPKEFWMNMYQTTLHDKKVWNGIITNKNKLGELYWVDSYIIADFDNSGKHVGYTSIRYDVTDLIKTNQEIEKKNTYLEHASKILRHDMHSGINTYIPRGVSSLERRLDEETIKKLKLEPPLRMIKEGLIHTQKVYKGVYEFTNLVKKDVVLNKTNLNLKEILENYLSFTSYKNQVLIQPLPFVEVNESLFCTAIDNLIRNGLKYNDSNDKVINIFMLGDFLIIQDNGRGLTQEEFNHLSKPYTRKQGQMEGGSGLGLNICVAILKEHGFSVNCEKNEIGTKIKIELKWT
jgi:chemotaxis family two-component system sensor kinase Cph1